MTRDIINLVEGGGRQPTTQPLLKLHQSNQVLCELQTPLTGSVLGENGVFSPSNPSKRGGE